jgi:uroporphyrinogen-III synthase
VGETERARPDAPLAGVGVIVTRPARQAGGFAQKLAALGATTVIFPTIAILPPEDSAALERVHGALATFDLAFFVSANAVEYGVPHGERWPAQLPAYAPGHATAAALAAVGVADVRAPATTMDSEGLLALPELADVRGRRAVIFRGDGGRELLGDALRARGADVTYVACYRRAAPGGGAEGLLAAVREGRANALTVTSSEGLDNLWAMLDAQGRALLARLPTFAPHPRIAAHARALGFDARETGPGDAGLVAGLLEWARAARAASS